MKLKEFLKKINSMVAKDKSLLELNVVYAIDDEGNSYHEVWNEPAVGYFEDNEFHFEGDEEDDEEDDEDDREVNAIVIN